MVASSRLFGPCGTFGPITNFMTSDDKARTILGTVRSATVEMFAFAPTEMSVAEPEHIYSVAISQTCLLLRQDKSLLLRQDTTDRCLLS